MKDQKSVSIVIPTFNRAEYLGRAIESCLEQTHPCEIIVCDHGSTDNTPKVAKQYEHKIKYIRREKDFGPHFCWLEGVLNAGGEYVHLQHDDDWIDPTYIEKCIQLFDHSVGFVFSDALIYDENSQKITGHIFEELFKEPINPSSKIEKFLMRHVLSPGACVFRKRDLLDALYQGNLPLANPQNTYLGVGPDCWTPLLCLLRYEKFGYIKEPLAYFRAHENSITIDAQSDAAKQKKITAAYNEVRQFYKQLKAVKKQKTLLGKYGLIGLLLLACVALALYSFFS